MTSYDEMMEFAARYRGMIEPDKHLVYMIFAKVLTWIVLPVSYEKAIQKLCRQMQY